MKTTGMKKRLITAVTVILIIASLAGVFSSLIFAERSESLGESPYINLMNGVNVDSEKFYDGTVIQRLPSGVKDSDELSLIVKTDEYALLDVYSDVPAFDSFLEFSISDGASAIVGRMNEKREDILSLLEREGVSFELGEIYTNVIGGFEITVKARDFVRVCSVIGNRADVIVGEVYKPAETKVVENNVNAFETGIFDTTGFGYDGTGIVVAVLDTGTDYYHTAFSMNNFTAAPEQWGMTFSDVESFVGDTAASRFESGITASDVYISGKLPYGYDYADKDTDVFPINNHHGTHVAGIIAGKDDTITGVAPGAQIATMKIFSDTDASARTSWILAALEDCVVLGVDVINMSIGTACGFSRENDKEQISGVYDKIRERGISMVVAASNSFNSTYSSDKNGNLGLTSNPDSATVGSPSTYKGAMSVASIEGAKTAYLLFGDRIIYFEESTDRVSEEKHFLEELLPAGVTEETIEYVVIPGSGVEADYIGIDVKGKIALIRRGSSTFEEKANTAELMGARAAIIYNNVSGDIKMNVGETAIPVCSISQNDGEALAATKTGTIKVSYEQKAGPFMSDFSSWGPSPSLGIKPEITAHGGSILSAVPGQEYDRISGTSMATPNVTGVTALLRQYVFETFPESVTSDHREVAAIVNRLLMSTADIVYNKNGNPYSVRKQGAGLANLIESAGTKAYILTYDRLDGSVMDKSKIELGDDPSRTGVYTLTFAIENFGTDSLTYNLSCLVMTEGVSETKTGHGETTVTETSYMLGAVSDIVSVTGGAVSGNAVTVAPGTRAKVELTLTLTDEDKNYLDTSFGNGMYVEGFILLDAEGATVDLNVPYLAFYGDWTESPMLDLDFYATNKDELDDAIDMNDKTLPDAYATRPIGGISDDYVSYLGSFYYEQKPGSNQVAANREYISLTNHENGVNSLRFIWAGMLRNAARVEVVITDDATGEVVYETVDYDIRKAYGDGGPIRPANIDVEFSAIEHNLKNNTKYTVTMKGYLDFERDGADTNLNNTFTFPLTVDFEAPTLTGCEFYTEYDRSEKKNRLYAKMAIYDNHYSMAVLPGYVLYNTTAEEPSFDFMNFERYLTAIRSEENSTSYVVYELTDYIDEIKNNSYHKNTFAITLYDYALNISTYEIALPFEYQDLAFESTEIILSPNQTYALNPLVYPSSEWGELVEYESRKPEVAEVVGGKIIAKSSGTAAIYAKLVDKDGSKLKEVKLTVKVLKKGDEGFKRYDPPVVESFSLSGYYVNKAYFFLNSDERDIGETGDYRNFVGDYYSLSMYPSESVTLEPEYLAYFPDKTSVVFESTNSEIVKVDALGTLTALKEGYASVTVSLLQDGESTYYSKTVDIEVKEPYVTSGPSLAHYYGLGGVVVIPPTLGVTDIGQYAFSNFNYVPKEEGDEISEENPELTKIVYLGDDTIEEVIIPEGVETIGPYAFAGLTRLRKVTLPSTVKFIDYGAFEGCTLLSKVVGLERVKFINRQAFLGTALEGDIALTSAIAVADYAFAANAKITGVRFSSAIQSIGAYAFLGNTALTSLNLPTGAVKLGEYAFMGCSELSSVSVNSAVIPEGAFFGCRSLELVELGRDAKVIGEYAFGKTKVSVFRVKDGNSSFVSTGSNYLVSADGTELLLVSPAAVDFTLDDGRITSIGKGAFSGNTGLRSVNIPSVNYVGDYAFSECTSLTSVTLGTLGYIGDYAFCNTRIEAIPANNAEKIGAYAFASTRITRVEISDGVTVGEGAFESLDRLKTVIIGDNVTLEKWAFRYNNDRSHYDITYFTHEDGRRLYCYVYLSPIDEITIGRNANIGEGAFWFASEVETVTLGEGALIGDYAFYTAPCLKNVIGISGAKSIGVGAFSGDILYAYDDQDCLTPAVGSDNDYIYRYYASAIESADLSSVSTLGSEAFAYCMSLVSVTLGEKITAIPEGAFRYCTALKYIDLSRVTEIGGYAFNATLIERLVAPLAEKIGEFAFVESEALSEVILGVCSEIGEGAFAYSPALAFATGLGNVKYLGDYAFAYTALTSADLTSCEYLGTHAFMKEEANKCKFDLTFGENIKEIGDNPFVWCEISPFVTSVSENFGETEYTKQVYTFSLGDTVRIIDGSLYRTVPDGLELVYAAPMSESFTVADGTVRVGAYSFIGTPVKTVVLPYTVRSIGHKAFFACDSLSLVSFSSYYAPVLEEEYDVYYFYEGTNLPTLPEFDSMLGASGLGIVNYFMWNVTADPTNIFYGANFKNYVGKVEDKAVMSRPVNGVGYDSFILSQYFDTVIEGAAAADDITLAAIGAISKLPDSVSLADRELVEAARALYNKISVNEQKALVKDYKRLTDAERRISDLLYLENENKPQEPEVTPDPEPTPDVGENDGGVNPALAVSTLVISVALISVILLSRQSRKRREREEKENKKDSSDEGEDSPLDSEDNND